MPPKPFRPPRPSSTSKPKNSSKVKKSTTTKSRPVIGLEHKDIAVKGKQKTNWRDSGAGRGSLGAGSNFGLPSLSPDSTQEAQPSSDEEVEIVDDDGDDQESLSSLPIREDEDDTDPTRNREEKLPLDLLQVLLQQFFTKPETRIRNDAKAAVGRYMETFVREGIARCVWARSEMVEGKGGGGFLEVEDLEKLAPQMLMDF
jgi:centromere protein X